MLTRENLLESLDELEIRYDVKEYGRGAVIKLELAPEPPYYIYTSVSYIDVPFWGVPSKVIDDMNKDNVDFAIAFVDGKNEEIYIYDKENSMKLLDNVSTEKKTGNYRLTLKDHFTTPINLAAFCEFVSSL